MLEYKLGIISDVRVYNGLSWAEFDFSGNLIRQSEADPIVPSFPADKMPEVIETIKTCIRSRSQMLI